MPEVKLCRARGCGQYASHDGFCNKHALTMNRQWRRSYPRDQFYATAEWKRTRKIVWERDGYLCQNVIQKWLAGKPLQMKCLKDVSGKGQAVAHHLRGWDGPDPYDPDGCITVCRECSGKLDGGRASTSRALEREEDLQKAEEDSKNPRSIIPPFV